jgi:zinc/manganese transport system permease protein
VGAESTQAVGALLFLGLLAAPAGAAHQLALSAYRGLALSVLFAVGSMWAGIALSYSVSSLPPSSAIMGFAASGYLVSVLLARRRRRLGGRSRFRRGLGY